MSTTRFKATVAALVCAAILPAAVRPELPLKPVLTLEVARRVGGAAYAEAIKRVVAEE